MLGTVGIRDINKTITALWEFVINKYRIILICSQDSHSQNTVSVTSIFLFFLSLLTLSQGEKKHVIFCETVLTEKCFVFRERVLVVQRGGCSHLSSGDAGVDTVQTMSVLKHNVP